MISAILAIVALVLLAIALALDPHKIGCAANHPLGDCTCGAEAALLAHEGE